MTDIPLAALERIMKKAGALRVGEDAKIAMRDHLEGRAAEIIKKANLLAEHAKRKTVLKEDITLSA